MKKRVKSLYFIFLSILMYIFRVFPIKNNRIIISNFDGMGYGDSLKYIHKSLSKFSHDIEFVWIVSSSLEMIPSGIKKVKRRSLKSLFYLSTSKIWLDNVRKEEWVRKRKNQIYIQLWHGCLAIKKIEGQCESVLNNDYVKKAKHDSEMIDLMISNSDFSTDLFSNYFWYDGIVENLGSPRLDSLWIDYEKIISIKKELKIPIDKDVIFYSPTFRDKIDLNDYMLNFDLIRKEFEKKFKKSMIIIIKLHPNLRHCITLSKLPIDVLDFTNYSDVYNLMAVSDYIISDYSSLLLEFPIAKTKPAFIYAKDYYDYNRSFNFDLRNICFPFSSTEGELLHNIMIFDYEQYKERVKSFYESIKLNEDGNSSIKVASKILELLEVKK